MEQAKWYKIILQSSGRGPVYEEFQARILKYHISLYKRITKSHGMLCVTRDRQLVPVIEFQIFCGQKKLKKLIEEAHLLGLEDELLIFRKE